MIILNYKHTYLIVSCLIRNIFSNEISISSNFVFSDQTIRPFGDSNDNLGFCAFKRYSDYIKDQEIWMWPCADAYHSNSKKAGKYWWSFDENTGLIRSEGSSQCSQQAKKTENESNLLFAYIFN